MAYFNSIFAYTIKYEGGYSYDPDDYGARTYKGISQKHHPNWQGWQIIEAAEISYMEGSIDEYLKNNSKLQTLVEKFYLETYWYPLCCEEMNQDVAMAVFDTAVNLGSYKSILFLQQGLNLLNRNGTLYPDLVEDGSIGPKTLAALKQYQEKDQPAYLCMIILILRGSHYINFMKKSPIQEKFARGWLKRLQVWW